MSGSESPGELPEPPTFGPEPQYPIESVDKALRVLIMLAQRRDLRITEVSAFLGVAASTAHRLLAVLSYRGLVRQGPRDRHYRPGPTLEQIALGVVNRMDLRTLARPVLDELNARCDETVHLVRLEGRDVLFLDAVESSKTLRVVSRLGKLMPAHSTSAGKALLAELSEAEVLELLPREDLPQATPHTIGTRTELLADLARIRSRGYATSVQENESGIESLGRAVGPAGAPAVAGIAVSVPQHRLDSTARKEIREALDRAVESLSRRLEGR